MAKIFITGSADGLGLLAARQLIQLGHEVVLHARNKKRADDAFANLPGATEVLIADLACTEETKALAAKANALGTFDVVIHNAGVYEASSKDLLAVNTLAPYLLTCLISKPQRLIYLSSDLHRGGSPKLQTFKTDGSGITYSDTKLHVLMLCKAVARKWPTVYANAVNPGWVPTKMGGSNAPDDLQKGYETQVWLAVIHDKKANVSGRFFYHKEDVRSNPEANVIITQEKFLNVCQEITGVAFPEN